MLDEAAGTAERRALAGAPQPVQRLGRDLQIGRGLVGGEEGRAALGAARALDVAFMVHEGLRVPCGAAARVPAGPRTSPAWPTGGSVETISRFDTPSALLRSAGPDELPLVAVAPPALGVERRGERRIVELEREVFGAGFARRVCPRAEKRRVGEAC